MKKTVEIECPDGYKPIYNAETGSVEIVPENIMDRVKTYMDAANILEAKANKVNRSVHALHKLQNILDVLNEGHKFELLEGEVWSPLVRFYENDALKKGAKIIGSFRYKGKPYILVGGEADHGGGVWPSAFSTYYGVGHAIFGAGMMACKNEEIAKYVSTQFGKLVFEACLASHFTDGEFEWID